MSVYRGARRKTYQYDFYYLGKHYKGNTYQTTEGEARAVEGRLRHQLRKAAGGILEARSSLSMTEWAGAYYEDVLKRHHRTGRPKRPAAIDHVLRVVLRFWGRRPADPDAPGRPIDGEEAPFHDLTLQDPIDDPTWIERFEEWIDRRNVAGQTRNHYMSRMSQLYVVAMRPRFRALTGVAVNPFSGIERSPKVSRKVALTPDRVLAWLTHMSYHARLAVSIAALAPKLRLQSILALERDAIDPGITTITVYRHKTDVVTGQPQVVPIVAQLRTILLDSFARMPPGTTHLVHYGGKPVSSIRASVRAAAREAGIPYGRYRQDGVTFHTLRHTAATILARLQVNPWLQRDVLGHQDLSTSDGYTHLQVEEQRPALERLSDTLPVADVVTRARRRALRTKTAAGGEVGGPGVESTRKAQESRGLTRGALMAGGRPFARKA